MLIPILPQLNPIQSYMTSHRCGSLYKFPKIILNPIRLYPGTSQGCGTLYMYISDRKTTRLIIERSRVQISFWTINFLPWNPHKLLSKIILNPTHYILWSHNDVIHSINYLEPSWLILNPIQLSPVTSQTCGVLYKCPPLFSEDTGVVKRNKLHKVTVYIFLLSSDAINNRRISKMSQI